MAEPRGHGGLTYDMAGEALSSVQARQMILIDQMIAWQLANPGKPWTQCAQALGVGTLFCRMLANTDAYRARYATVGDQVIKEVGLFGLKERIAVAAEMAVERLAEKIPTIESVGDLTDATEMLLGHHFGKNPTAPTPSTTIVNTQLIVNAREAIMAPKAAIEVKPEE